MEEQLKLLLAVRTKKVDMTPIRLEGDDEDEEDAGDDNNEDDNEDDDEESTPVPRSKRPNAAACVLLRSFFWGATEQNLPNPVRNSVKSRHQQQEEEDDEASEPADSILDSESEGEETTEVDGLLDDDE